MFKELVSLAIIVGFILNIFYVEHPNTTSYTIAFVLGMALFSPFALAWRYRAFLGQLRAVREAGDEVEGEPFVSVSGTTGISKGVPSIADVEMGLLQANVTAAVPLERT